MSRKEVIETMPEDLIKEMGYTEEELEVMKQELVIGGSNA